MDKNREKDYIIGLKRGDFASFDQLFSVYKERLYAFALGYLKSTEYARELVQEVFIKVWENREELDEEKSFNAYLFTISKNIILNHLRKRANDKKYIEYIKQHTGIEYTKTEEKIEYSDLEAQAKKIIDQLPPGRKKIYRLSREEGLTYEEIAKKLNISKKTVENQMSRALKFLRERLDNGKLITLLFIALLL